MALYKFRIIIIIIIIIIIDRVRHIVLIFVFVGSYSAHFQDRLVRILSSPFWRFSSMHMWTC